MKRYSCGHLTCFKVAKPWDISFQKIVHCISSLLCGFDGMVKILISTQFFDNLIPFDYNVQFMSILWGNSMPHLNSMEQLPLDLKQESAQKFIYCVVRVVQRNGSLMCWCLIYFHCGWLWHKDISAIKLSCRVTIVVLEFSEWRKLSETFYWLVGASWNLSVVRECCCGQHIGATHISGTTFSMIPIELYNRLYTSFGSTVSHR